MNQPMPLHTRLLVGTALCVLLAAAYGNGLRNELVFDDLMFMQNDPRVHSVREAYRLFIEPLWGADPAGRAGVHQYYRPLQLLPLTASYALFGTAAWPAHLLNILLHLVNCLLVLAIFRRLLAHDASAIAATLLFAVHPAYSESVFWVSDVAGLGASCCILAIVRLHLDDPWRWYGWLLTPLLFLIGLWFKELGIIAIALVVAYDVVGASDRGWRRLWRLRWRYTTYLPPFAIYLAFRLHALGGLVPGLGNVPFTPVERVLNGVALIPEFVSTFVWPFDLNMYHDFNAVHGVANWPFCAGALTLLAAAVAVALTVRRRRAAAYAVTWALLTTAPFLLIRWPRLNVFAERYVYLPAIGVLLFVAAAAVPWLTVARRRWLIAVVGALVIVGVVVDARRSRDWHDEVTIYSKTLTQSARAELIRINLAVRLLDQQRYDEGIALLEGLVTSDPEWRDAWYNLGLLYLGKGEDEKASTAFERAWQTDPTNRPALLNLGYAYDRMGRREQAVETYLQLVTVEPGNAQGWYNLAVIAWEGGQFGNARTAVDKVLALTPQDADARLLRTRLDRLGATEPHAERAPDPNTARRCAEAKQELDAHHYAVAIRRLRMAAWLDEAAPLPHQYLANVYFLAGRLEAAIDAQRAALQRAPHNEVYRSNLASLDRALAARKQHATADAPADQ